MAANDTSDKTGKAEEQSKANELTKAAAAKLVKRQVPIMKEGKVQTNDKGEVVFKDVAVKESEVLSFRDYGDHVVIVTIQGEKLRGAK